MCNNYVISPLFEFVYILCFAEDMDELSFNEGDLIMLKTRIGTDWLRGKLINGGEGIFPANFVEIVVSK